MADIYQIQNGKVKKLNPDSILDTGNPGQVLTKMEDGLVSWKDIPESGLTESQVQDKINQAIQALPEDQVSTEAKVNELIDAKLENFSSLPEGGTQGQVLTKTEEGTSWQDAPQSGLTEEQIDSKISTAIQALPNDEVSTEAKVNELIDAKLSNFNSLPEGGNSGEFLGLDKDKNPYWTVTPANSNIHVGDVIYTASSQLPNGVLGEGAEVRYDTYPVLYDMLPPVDSNLIRYSDFQDYQIIPTYDDSDRANAVKNLTSVGSTGSNDYIESFDIGNVHFEGHGSIYSHGYNWYCIFSNLEPSAAAGNYSRYTSSANRPLSYLEFNFIDGNKYSPFLLVVQVCPNNISGFKLYGFNEEKQEFESLSDKKTVGNNAVEIFIDTKTFYNKFKLEIERIETYSICGKLFICASKEGQISPIKSIPKIVGELPSLGNLNKGIAASVDFTGVTNEQVTNLIDAKLEGFASGITSAEVDSKIDEAIKALPSDEVSTEAKVNELIDAKLESFESGTDEETVNNLIDNKLENLEHPVQSAHFETEPTQEQINSLEDGAFYTVGSGEVDGIISTSNSNIGRNIGDVCYTVLDNLPDECLFLDGSIVSGINYPDLYQLVTSWRISSFNSKFDIVPHYEPSDKATAVQGYTYSGSGISYKEEYTINGIMSVVNMGPPWNIPNSSLESFNIFNTNLGTSGYSSTLYQGQPGYDCSIEMTFPTKYNPFGIGVLFGAGISGSSFPTTFKFYGINDNNELDLLIEVNDAINSYQFLTYNIITNNLYNKYKLVAKSSSTALVISQLSIYGYNETNPIDKLIQLPNIPANEYCWKAYIVAKK